MPHNALRAAALRGLLEFIFAIHFHVHRPGLLCRPTAPALRMPACYVAFILCLTEHGIINSNIDKVDRA
jgi:hypothetical protein